MEATSVRSGGISKQDLLKRGKWLHAEIASLDEQIRGVRFLPKKARKLRLSQLIAKRELTRLEYERVKREFHGWPEPGTWNYLFGTLVRFLRFSSRDKWGF